MSALYAAGRQVEALAAYREFAERLADMGLHPMKETRELERRILTQEVGEEPPPGDAAPRSGARRPSPGAVRSWPGWSERSPTRSAAPAGL